LISMLEKVVEVKPRRLIKPSQTLRDLRNLRDMARQGGHKERFRILRNKCSSMCRKESMLEACKKLKENPNFVWQCHSSHTGKKESESIKLHGDRGRVLSDNEASTVAKDWFMNRVDRIREEMAERGKPIFQTKRRALKLGTASVNHDQVWRCQLYGLRPASIRQVRKSIKKAKNSTAVDLDGLSTNMLKLHGRQHTGSQ
jgi:hypothetical protein